MIVGYTPEDSKSKELSEVEFHYTEGCLGF